MHVSGGRESIHCLALIKYQYLLMRGTLRTRAIKQNSSCAFWESLKILKSIQNSQDLYNMCKWYRLLRPRMFIFRKNSFVSYRQWNKCRAGLRSRLVTCICREDTKMTSTFVHSIEKKIKKMSQVKVLHLLGLFNDSSICATNWPMISILWI